MEGNEVCKCGCQDSEVVRRAVLRLVCSYLLAKEHQEPLVDALQKVSFCCTYELRSYHFDFLENNDILARFPHHAEWIQRDMLRICDGIVNDHKACPPDRCSKSAGSMIPLHYCSANNLSIDNSESSQQSQPPMSDEELYRIACELFDGGFVYYAHRYREDMELYEVALTPDRLFLHAAAIPLSYRNSLAGVSLALKVYDSSSGIELEEACRSTYEEVGFTMKPLRNMIGLVLPDDYFIFLFPQRFQSCHDRDLHRLLDFSSPEEKIWFFARHYLANTESLNSIIGGFVSGCSVLQSYFHFLQRFPPGMLKFLENVALVRFPSVDVADQWNATECTEIVRTAVLVLLREPKFVVGALREWYRFDHNMTTPNGRTFDDALTIARTFSKDPLFGCVAGEVQEFLDSKEWLLEKAYKMSDEVLFAPLPWHCECKEGFEYGTKLDDATKLKLIPTLRRFEPKMTNEQLMNDLDDTLARVHPCMPHFLREIIAEYAILCPLVVQMVLGYLRHQRDMHSPYNVAVTMRTMKPDGLDLRNPAVCWRLIELFKKVDALEREGYSVLRDGQVTYDMSIFRSAPLEANTERRRMMPCPHKKSAPFTFALLGRMACKVIYALTIKSPDSLLPNTNHFHDIVRKFTRVPRCMLHGLEYVIPDKSLTFTLQMFDVIQKMADSESYIAEAMLSVDFTTLPNLEELVRTACEIPAPPTMKIMNDKSVAKCMKAVRKRERQEKQRQKEARELEERKARAKKTVGGSSHQWMEPPKPISEPNPMTSPPMEIQKEVLPPPIPCSICVQDGNGTIQPRKEVYVKLKCYNACSHSIALHKSCFKAAFDGKRKKEIKMDGRCPLENCGAKMESIYEVDMDRGLTETLFLKWEPPATVHEYDAVKGFATLTPPPDKVSHAPSEDSEVPTGEMQPEEQEPEPELEEPQEFCLRQDLRRAVLSRPPLPLSMADFAVRLERKSAEAVEKYAAGDGMSTKTKKPRQRQHKETINLADLTGSSIARVPGRHVVGPDGKIPRCRQNKSKSTRRTALSQSEAPQSSNDANLKPDITSGQVESREEEELVEDLLPCTICMEPLFMDDSAVAECRHCEQYIHRECVEKWLIKEQSCPMCRANWPSDEHFPPLR